jgi:hypothetical protein
LDKLLFIELKLRTNLYHISGAKEEEESGNFEFPWIFPQHTKLDGGPVNKEGKENWFDM